MPEENESKKIEVYKSGDARIERRRVPPAPVKIGDIEKAPDLVACWKVIRRRGWTVFMAFSVLFGVVLVGTLMQKPVYRAKVLLEIDKENPSLVTAQELFQFDEVSDAYLETQYKVLGSDDLAERVIGQLGLSRVAEFLPRKAWWPWTGNGGQQSLIPSMDGNGKVRDPAIQEVVLARFQERLAVKPIRRSRAVEVSFESQDPNLAASVVNTLAASYIQKNLEARWDATQKASEWLSTQLQDLKTKLEKSEDALQRYTTENGLLFLETEKGNTENVVNQSLRELQEELSKAQAARYEKESFYRIRNSTGYGSLPGAGENKVLQELSVRLAELQREHAQLVTTFTEEYPRVKEIQSQIIEIQAALDREHQHAVQKISNDYYAALRREALLQRAFAEKQRQVNLIAEKSVQYGILSRDVDSNKNLYDGLLQRLKEAGVSAGLRASNIRIVDPGKAPYKPFSPKIPLNLGLAAILGLGLGACAAFFQEHIDQTLKNAKDVELFLRVPALAFIPSLKSLNGRGSAGFTRMGRGVTLDLYGSKEAPSGSLAIGLPAGSSGSHNAAILAEAFRGLRTSVLLTKGSRPVSSILVTSAQCGEGKTTIAMNLAISLAQLGRRVLLIEADLRRPSVHQYFPQSGSQLSSCLGGQGKWQEMTYQTSTQGLSVLLCGPVPSNPAELLSSDLMRTLIREATAEFNFVILDSPPLLSVADSRILASMVDATVLVVKGAGTHRQVVQYAKSQVQSAGSNLIGVVLNNLDIRLDDYPYYANSRGNAALSGNSANTTRE